jgi:hypothetical protein
VLPSTLPASGRGPPQQHCRVFFHPFDLQYSTPPDAAAMEATPEDLLMPSSGAVVGTQERVCAVDQNTLKAKLPAKLLLHKVTPVPLLLCRALLRKKGLPPTQPR